jgi:hypothetical protein
VLKASAGVVSGSATTSDLPEGSNLYYTDARVESYITAGEGIDFASGVISGEDATTVNKGIASFNSTNFSVSSGAVNTIQDIDSTATPSFDGLNITGDVDLNNNTLYWNDAVGSIGSIAYNGNMIIRADTDIYFYESDTDADRVSFELNSGAYRFELGSSQNFLIESLAAGDSSIDQNISGVLLTAQSMNVVFPYTPGLNFGSTDTAFTTHNPKILAGICGEATETYSSDTDSGMGLIFYTTPDNAGASPSPSIGMRLDQDGNLRVGTASGDVQLSLQGNATSSICTLEMGDTADADIGAVKYSNTADQMWFVTNAATALTLYSDQSAEFEGDVTMLGTGHDYVIYADIKSDGSRGGSVSSNSWNTRALNSVKAEKDDSASFSTLSSNQFTLQAGRYLVFGKAVSVLANREKLRLYNVTDSSIELLGLNGYSSSGGYWAHSIPHISGEINITSAKTFLLQHFFNGNGGGTYAKGVDSGGAGTTEEYAYVYIIRMGPGT